MDFIDKTYALSNIKRFQNKNLDIEYNVAEHSFRVSKMCMVAAEIYNLTCDKKDRLDVLLVVKKSLLHDDEESVSGDYPGHLKTPLLKKELRRQGRAIMKHMLRFLPKSIREDYYKCWLEDKDGPEGELLALVDKFEGFLTCSHEFMRSNVDIKNPLLSHMITLESEKYQRLFEKFSYLGDCYKIRMKELDQYTIRKHAMSISDFFEKYKEDAIPKFFNYYEEIDKEIEEEVLLKTEKISTITKEESAKKVSLK